MASNNGSQAPIGQNKQTNIPFNGHPGANASLFLEKTKAGMRGSTPDSEALASSDDELDHHHRVQPVNVIQSSRPTRRPSWLSETQHVPQRKGSLGSGGTFSPTHTFNSTPPGEQGVWGSNGAPPTSSVGRGHSSSGSIPWGSAIWSSDSQKGPPSRLTEVLPSPTTVVQSASNNLPVDESLLSPTLGREASNESSFPFAIPLHPTLKTYRSQSYSVGQLDPEAMSLPSSNLSGHHLNSRSRSGIPYAGLHRRPSRSSALGDMSHDSSLLGQLREVDDDESSTGSEAGVQLSATQARAIEKLAMENALLRQAAAEQIEDNTKARNRAVSTNSVPRLPRTSIQAHHQRVHETVPEEPSGGLHRLDETQTEPFSQGGVRSRRSTEYISRSGQQYNSSTLLENRNLESIKKGHWQSSLGFGGLVEPPQSRRHSFAEVPTRQTSISSASEQQNGHGGGENGIRPSTGHRSPVGYRDSSARLSQGDTELKHLRDRSFAASYFSGMDPSMRSPDIHGHPSMSPVMVQHGYSTHHPYGRPQSSANPPSRPTQLLYVVTFKACRADVFYVSEGTGLQIRPGDLVIVEADRGTDLGTVAYDHLSLSKAKDLKDFYTEEHYRWLMMFSRRGQTAGSSLGAPNQPNPSSGLQTSAVGAVGAAGQSQDISGAELKPKMIKRLAQAHEIQTLRDKEGNEAKAKRVCQQKVVEHRLNMEVLDAEFQMDWKKLTFYYFADAYVNFNPLVTDLFKIYKTRIWMSAINPASFVTPSLGLQLPSGAGPGAFASDNEHYTDHLQYKITPNLTAVSSAPKGQGQGHFERMWDQGHEPSGIAPVPFTNVLTQQSFATPEFDVRRADQFPNDFHESSQQALGLQPRLNPLAYNISELPASSYTLPPSNSAARKSNVLSGDWNQSFQGLSLGSSDY